jgi:beta-catenin-like protein 1
MQMLGRKTKSLKDIVNTLQIYRDNVDEDEKTLTVHDSERAPSQKEILRHLIDFLDNC